MSLMPIDHAREDIFLVEVNYKNYQSDYYHRLKQKIIQNMLNFGE